MSELTPCISSASFQRVDRIVVSAWKPHAPFAFWLIEAHRPGVVAELGTHNGFSYLCFCQQINKMGLKSECTAIDTWQGDVHAGFYGDDVFHTLKAYHDDLYCGFSQLLRSSFDDAVGRFSDRSIDLLHIDGRHEYSDVRHDYETWERKLSDRAIVLFHDTQVRERGFGVFRFWQEIRTKYPYFEFTHGYGLGVLGVGKAHRAGDFPLFRASADSAASERVRHAYEKLGSVVETSGSMRRNEDCPCGSGKRFKKCHGAMSSE